MTLKIAQGFSLPPDTVTQTLGIVAQRGAGKTYLTAVLSEEMIGARLSVVIVDPMGVYWGLRLAADGKAPGLDVVILGGERGDVPLEPTAGKVIADWIATEHRACVLDLSGFRKGEQRQFVTDFAEELYRKNRDPLHLILDEADMWAPQRPQPGEQRMLGAIEDLVRRGRARGIGLSLVTQRPAVIHKDVLTQVSALVALRIVGPQDRKAVEEWTKYHDATDEREAVLSSLGSLPIGTAWFWSPGWLGKLEKVAVRARRTFDSSSTPKVGEKRAAPRELAPVDLEALRGKIADTIARAKADDPKALKVRIAELEKLLNGKTIPMPAPERVEVPMFDAEAFAELERAAAQEVTESIDRLRLALGNQKGILHTYRSKCLASNGAKAGLGGAPRVVNAPTPAAQPRAIAPTTSRQNGTSQNGGAGDGSLGKCERAILSALVQHGQLTLTQAAIIARYSVTSSTPGNAASKLRGLGYVDGANTTGLSATPTGSAALGPVEPLPTGRELARFWLDNLARCESEILAEVIRAYPNAVGLKAAAEARGYSTESSTPGNAASKLRALSLVHGSNAGMTADERLVD